MLGICSLQAQKPYFKAAFSVGDIIKHNTDIIFVNDAPSYDAELSLVWQTQGQRPWHQLQKFPRFSIALRYHDLGEKDIVGEAIGLRGAIDIPLFRKNKSALHYSFGTGLAYLTSPFDRIDNQENNAIGSHLNNSVDMKLDYEHQLGTKAKIHLGIGLSHYSNGARKLPNLGLNIPHLYLGISPYRGSHEEDFFKYLKVQKQAKRKWGFGVHFQYTQVEIRLPGGPNFPTYVAAIEANYLRTKNIRWSLGYQYDYNSSIAEFGLQTTDFMNQKEAFVGASRHSLTVGNDFLFGPWSMQLKLGVYTSTNSSFLLPRPFYFMISPRYTFNYQSEGLKIYTGLNVKSHLFVAEFISWGFGVVF